MKRAARQSADKHSDEGVSLERCTRLVEEFSVGGQNVKANKNIEKLVVSLSPLMW